MLYSVGIMLASLTNTKDQLWLLVLTYGVMGGIGLGLAYITPIAMLAKWFPDKRGLITGIAVGGFGFGAVITGPVAKSLLDGTSDKTSVFLPLGIAYLVAGLLGASLFRNPPEGYAVPGYDPAASKSKAKPGSRAYTLPEALADAAVVHAHGDPHAQHAVRHRLHLPGVGLGPAADRDHRRHRRDLRRAHGPVQRRRPDRLGGAVGPDRPHARLPRHAARCRGCASCSSRTRRSRSSRSCRRGIYLAYGGGFGTMPATAADYYGTPNAGAIYGAMIIAWSIGGVVGPLIAARLYESSGGYTVPFTVLGIVALISTC